MWAENEPRAIQPYLCDLHALCSFDQRNNLRLCHSLTSFHGDNLFTRCCCCSGRSRACCTAPSHLHRYRHHYRRSTIQRPEMQKFENTRVWLDLIIPNPNRYNRHKRKPITNPKPIPNCNLNRHHLLQLSPKADTHFTQCHNVNDIM